MRRSFWGCLPLMMVFAGGLAAAGQDREQHGGDRQEHGGDRQEHGGDRPGGHEMAHGEPHPGPRGYQRVEAPHGWDQRPHDFDRGAYQHNFQAEHVYRIGPYHRPPGWTYRRWGYGEFLPRAYWAAPYVVGDYWLFALEVPPQGYEWVRSGPDALLINTANGEILQVEYGVFA